MGNNVEMDKRNNQMTNSRNVFCRFFRTVVMVHKIVYVRHFNRARKQKKWSVYYISRRAYGFAILPNLVLLLGTELAQVGSDGQMQPSAHVWQSVVEYTLTGWAFLFMAIPILFDGTHGSLQREVRQELRERPRYWKRAVAVYWAAIVAAVVAVNVMFLYLKPEAVPQKNEPQSKTVSQLPKAEMKHQENFKTADDGNHRSCRQQPPARVFVAEPCENLIPALRRISETAKDERDKQHHRDSRQIEPPAAYHPVKKGQQRQGRIQVPASHEQCRPVARRLFPHVKRLAHKPYIVYPFQHSRAGCRKPAVKIQIFRLLRQDCEAFL